MDFKAPHILLVNPWIHDFAAYDVWAKPMGLLILASVLRDHGFQVSYVDCLDRFHPEAPVSDPGARNGRGPYTKTTISHPKGLEDISRRFSRYGIKPEWLKNDLAKVGRPDLIFVTSMMTYWAPGVRETIQVLKETFGKTPVVLGGIYATLCHEHAEKKSGADRVIKGPAEHKVLELVAEYTGYHSDYRYDPTDINALPYPAYDLQRVINYIPIQTSRGCPFRCSYCASGFLAPKWSRRHPESVVDELKYWHDKHNVVDFAFYDDALLVDSKNHAEIIFQGVIDSGMEICFHTPNALHVREISDKVASLMHRAGFKTLRLGVETVDFCERDQMDDKITASDFGRAISALQKAGFNSEQTGAYLLTGLPGQSFSDVEKSVRAVLDMGVTPVLTHYTPIPHTAMWDTAVSNSRYKLAEDPVFTNNSILPCRQESFSWEEISRLKKMITGKRQIKNMQKK